MPPDEAKRLQALRKLGVLDTPPSEEFDAIARAASLVCGMPIGLDLGRAQVKPVRL